MLGSRLAVLLLVAASVPLAADFAETLREADTLYASERYADLDRYLTDAMARAEGGEQTAELAWRWARCAVYLAEELRDSGAARGTILALYERGDREAGRAVELAPRNHLGYYWRAANLGKAVGLEGPVTAIREAGVMKDLLDKAIALAPEFPDAYYVLGVLYRQVPGAPIDFGSVDHAVSLGRRSVDLMQMALANPDFSIELAHSLYSRGWSAQERARQHAIKAAEARAADPVKAALSYEGTVTLKPMSDREEALEMISGVIAALRDAGGGTKVAAFRLAKAEALRAQWGGLSRTPAVSAPLPP